MGQVGGIKITLRLGQVDANAAQDAPALLLVAVADAFAQDAHDLFAVQQQVVGPLDLAVHAVAQGQLSAHGKAGQQGQGGGLRQRLPDGDCVVWLNYMYEKYGKTNVKVVERGLKNL